MEFLGIGYQELLLVLILMLVVVGPERLPGMAYQIGRAVRTLQQYARQVRNEFSDEINYLEEQVRVVRGEVDTLNAEMRDQSARFNQEFKDATAPIESELRDVTQPPPGGTPATDTNHSAHPEATAEPASLVPSEASLVLSNAIAANGVKLNENGSAPHAPTPEPTAASSGDGGKPPLVF